MKIPHLLCSTEHSCVSLATGSDQSSQLYGWNPSPTLSHLPHSPGFWKLFWGPHKVQSPQPGPIKRPAQCSTRLQASPGTARGTNRRGGWAWRGSGWPRLGSVGPSASPASQALLLLFRPLFSLFTVNSCAKKPGRCHPVTSRGWVPGSPAERRFEGVEKKCVLQWTAVRGLLTTHLLLRTGLPLPSLQSAGCLVERFWDLPRLHPEKNWFRLYLQSFRYSRSINGALLRFTFELVITRLVPPLTNE